MSLPARKWESIERQEKVMWRSLAARGKYGHISDGEAWTTTNCPRRVLYVSAHAGLHSLATTYQRQRSKELFKFQGRWMTHIWCVFSLLESSVFDGQRGRRGFVIEVKNNKATACWPTLPVQRPWYESNALCMPLRTSRGYRKACGFWSCFPSVVFHLTHPPKLSLELQQKTEQRSANPALRGSCVFLLRFPLSECTRLFWAISSQRNVTLNVLKCSGPCVEDVEVLIVIFCVCSNCSGSLKRCQVELLYQLPSEAEEEHVLLTLCMANMSANYTPRTTDWGYEEEGIPKDNMFGLEPIRWTYIFLPHKFPWSAPPQQRVPPNTVAANFNSLDSAFPLYKFHPFHLRVAFIIRNVSLYVR